MVYMQKLVNGIDEKIEATNDEKIKAALMELKKEIKNGDYGDFENGYDD